MFTQNRIQKAQAEKKATSKYLRRWNPDVKRKVSKIDPEVKAKWLEALRSGEYEQGHGQLRQDHDSGSCYCCLGVLTDILDPDGWDESVGWAGTRTHRFKGSKHPNETYPNQAQMMKIGLYPGDSKELARLNDDEDKSFVELADIIEKRF